MPLCEVTAGDERSLQDIADHLAKSHRQIIVTGAGISTSCGIPDFRSKDGLYNIAPEQAVLPTPPSSRPSTPSSRKRKAYTSDDDEPPSSQTSIFSSGSYKSSPTSRMKGQDLFHARVFQSADTTTAFYQFIATLRRKIQDEVQDTSATHKFIRALRDGGRLIRCYTQNIDGLEAREGLCMELSRGKGNKRRFMKKNYAAPRPQVTANTDFDAGCEVVQLHGELSQLRCRVCASEQAWTDEDTEIFLNGAASKCEKCAEKSDIRQATGKRGLAVGELRPNIVLYGEDHPQNSLLTPIISFDLLSLPDVLIIMGTSLKVHGLQKIVRDFAKAVHSQKHGRVIFVNRTRPAESQWDGVIDDYIAMDCDDWVADLRRRREDLWLRQGELDLKQGKQQKKKRKSVDSDTEAPVPPPKKVKVTVDVPPLRKVEKPKTSGWKTRPLSPGKSAKMMSPLVQRLRPDCSPVTKHKGTAWKQAHFEVLSDPDTVVVTPSAPAWTPMTRSEKRSPLSQMVQCEDETPTPHQNLKNSHDKDEITYDSTKRRLKLHDENVQKELSGSNRPPVPTVRALFSDMLASVGLR